MPHAGYTVGLGELHMLKNDSRMETLENMQLWLYTYCKVVDTQLCIIIAMTNVVDCKLKIHGREICIPPYSIVVPCCVHTRIRIPDFRYRINQLAILFKIQNVLSA